MLRKSRNGCSMPSESPGARNPVASLFSTSDLMLFADLLNQMATLPDATPKSASNWDLDISWALSVDVRGSFLRLAPKERFFGVVCERMKSVWSCGCVDSLWLASPSALLPRRDSTSCFQRLLRGCPCCQRSRRRGSTVHATSRARRGFLHPGYSHLGDVSPCYP